MIRTLQSILKFFVAFFLMTIINTFVWECVTNNLYDCTDGGVPGYWSPGDWVHNFDGHSVESVPHIVHGRQMNEPDTIKQGWSTARLLYLWFLFFGVSLLVSLRFAGIRRMPKLPTEPITS